VHHVFNVRSERARFEVTLLDMAEEQEPIAFISGSKRRCREPSMAIYEANHLSTECLKATRFRPRSE
jgi:hypothetical protein